MRQWILGTWCAAVVTALAACGAAGPDGEDADEALAQCGTDDCDSGKADGFDEQGGGSADGSCYEESHDTTVSLADLKQSYSRSQWLRHMLQVLDRRYDDGFALMNARKSDPWLTSSFPSYFDLSTWAGLMESIDTACHEETHGYDFDAALREPDKHVFYMRADLQVSAPKLPFFPRNEIYSYTQLGGSVTSSYDSLYLTGSQGALDFIFLGDELTAYINGLACATAVGDQLDDGYTSYSFRDGAAAHMLYLLYYLRHARTTHAELYEQWKASADWQRFVRQAWARGVYWTEASRPFRALGIRDAAIWERIDQPSLLAEIEKFTGENEAVVACEP